MTLAEKFGTFEAYQKDAAEKALAYQKQELETLRTAARGGNDYAVRMNIGHNEVLRRLESTKAAIIMLTKLIEADGAVKNPLYLQSWNILTDKEC